jgi:hypothetical protein
MTNTITDNNMSNVMSAAQRGAPAGLVGGLAFAVWATLAQRVLRPAWGLQGRDVVKDIAAIVGSDKLIVGMAVHLVISAALGVAFAVALSLSPIRCSRSRIFALGTVWGPIWWALGTLTMLPLLGHRGLPGLQAAWSHALAGSTLLGLIGHLLFGVVVAAVLTRSGQLSSSNHRP